MRQRTAARRRYAVFAPLAILTPMLPTIFAGKAFGLGLAAKLLTHLAGLHRDRVAALEQRERFLQQPEVIERAFRPPGFKKRRQYKIAHRNAVDLEARLFDGIGRFVGPQ